MAIIEPKTVTLKNGRQVCICTPGKDDVPLFMDYMEKIFADDRYFLTTAREAKDCWTPEKTGERIEKNAANANTLMVATVADGAIVSMSHADCGPKQRTQHVADMGISILPAFRGIGLGTAIMQAMIDWAAAHPRIEKLSLDVQATNEPALALYHKLGFVEQGRKPRELKYADGSYGDMITMYRFIQEKGVKQ